MDSDNRLIEPSTVLSRDYILAAAYQRSRTRVMGGKANMHVCEDITSATGFFSTACVLTLDNNSDVKITEAPLFIKDQENPKHSIQSDRPGNHTGFASQCRYTAGERL